MQEEIVQFDVLLSQLASILSQNLVTNSFAIDKAKTPLRTILRGSESAEEKRMRNIWSLVPAHHTM